MSKIIVYLKNDNKELIKKFNISGYEVELLNDNLPLAGVTNRDLFFVQFSLFDEIKKLHNFIKNLKRKYEHNKIVLLNDVGNMKEILPLLSIGVSDYINVPFRKKNLINLILNLHKHHIYEYDVSEVHRLIEEELSFIGESKLMLNLNNDIIAGFQTSKPIFITGEFGVQKFKIANFIHKHGRFSNGVVVRRNMQHVKYNEDDLEGIILKLFSSACMGTLIFEELNNGIMAVDEFIKYVLELRRREKMGKKLSLIFIYSLSSGQKIKISNNSIHVINIPGLRKINQDIPFLAGHYMQQLSKEFAVSSISLKKSVYPILQSYDWPGNFFEFYNLLDLLFMNALRNNITIIEENLIPDNLMLDNPANINPDVNYDIMSSDLKTARRIFEKQYISAQIKRFEGNISNTASFIGMERTALHRKLISLEINSDNIRRKVRQ